MKGTRKKEDCYLVTLLPKIFLLNQPTKIKNEKKRESGLYLHHLVKLVLPSSSVERWPNLSKPYDHMSHIIVKVSLYVCCADLYLFRTRCTTVLN